MQRVVVPYFPKISRDTGKLTWLESDVLDSRTPKESEGTQGECQCPRLMIQLATGESNSSLGGDVESFGLLIIGYDGVEDILVDLVSKLRREVEQR